MWSCVERFLEPIGNFMPLIEDTCILIRVHHPNRLVDAARIMCALPAESSQSKAIVPTEI